MVKILDPNPVCASQVKVVKNLRVRSCLFCLTETTRTTGVIPTIPPCKINNITKTFGPIHSITNNWIPGLLCKSVVIKFYEKGKQFGVITNYELRIIHGQFEKVFHQ